MRRAYLVRHAKAGSRYDFEDEDDLRPLTKRGREQAEALAELLESHGLGAARLLSSPALRCEETLSPLAAALELPVERVEWLAEGSDPMEALGLLQSIDEEVVVASTHGDVIWGILEWLARGGVEIGASPDSAKASTWVLDWPDEPAEGVPVRASYLPPPP